MEIVYRLDPRYNAARQIANARFDYLYPAVIYFCESVANVQRAIQDAKDQGLHVRVRSGGHHHEGMCSGPNVLMIDVSRIDGMHGRGRPGSRRSWREARQGVPTLWKAGKLFPGGGCEDVRVGGLVQGGGWGPYGRSLGLTCDRLTWFRIVKADGNVLEVSDSPQDPHSDLFWAVCGGGGGNFGVITEFLFKPGPLTTPIFSFTAKWTDPKLVGTVIDDWRANFPDDNDLRLTSFARLSAVAGRQPRSSRRSWRVSSSARRRSSSACLRACCPTRTPRRDHVRPRGQGDGGRRPAPSSIPTISRVRRPTWCARCPRSAKRLRAT